MTDTSTDAVERLARHLAPLLMGTTLQGAPDTFRALAAERDAARAEAARLREALEQVAERSTGPQDKYDRNGPTWISRKTGHEYEDTSTHLEFAQEVGDIARAALAGEAGRDR